MRPITMLPSLPLPSPSPPHPHWQKKKSRQVKRRDGSARLLRRSALKVPFAYLAKNATRRKKDADAICKTPTGVGRERAMVIEEARGRGERRRREVKVGKANFVIPCDSPEARSV